MGQPGESLDLRTAQELATHLNRMMRMANESLAGEGSAAQLIEKVTGHLGVELKHVIVVNQIFDMWEHASLQHGVDHYLAERGEEHKWFGIAGGHRGHEDTISMLTTAQRHGMYELGAVDLTTAAVGPSETRDVVQLGLVCTTAPAGEPVVLAVRAAAPMPMRMEPSAQFEVLAPSREAAIAVRDRVDELVREHDVLRGQVLAYGVSEHRANQLVTFLPRPHLRDDEVVLPDGVLAAIEQHVAGIGVHADRLRAVGQHLKRGLLLHGVPGTGKTHTVRYLMGLLPKTTVIVLTGPAMKFIAHATALARRLQPAMVVVEDVDLVAQDRSMSDHGQPLLFTLLEAMDGTGSDADVTFVLTTNRVEVLERALADRPGRVDLAVEIPRPDATGRENLFRLYGREVDLVGDLGPIVAATDGITASFVKELVRRAVLRTLTEDSKGPISVTVDALMAEFETMQQAQNSITRTLLGGTAGS